MSHSPGTCDFCEGYETARRHFANAANDQKTADPEQGKARDLPNVHQRDPQQAAGLRDAVERVTDISRPKGTETPVKDRLAKLKERAISEADLRAEAIMLGAAARRLDVTLYSLVELVRFEWVRNFGSGDL